MNNKELIKNSIDTICEMLIDRKISLENIDRNVLKNIIDNINIHKLAFPIILDEKIKILYYMSNKFKFSEIKEFYKDKKYYKEFLVIIDKVSANNQKLLHALNKNIEIFHIKELQFNITKHKLQPSCFSIINENSQIDNIMKTYNLKSKSQLPLILKTDPISKYYGLKSGDIIKITRISETSGLYTYYRYCN